MIYVDAEKSVLVFLVSIIDRRNIFSSKNLKNPIVIGYFAHNGDSD